MFRVVFVHVYLCSSKFETIEFTNPLIEPNSLGESGFETGKVHTVWFVLLHSSSRHLATEGHTRPRGTVSPSLCGTLNFPHPNQSGEPGEVEMTGWWVRGISQQALLSEHPGPLQPGLKLYKIIIIIKHYIDSRTIVP